MVQPKDRSPILTSWQILIYRHAYKSYIDMTKTLFGLVAVMAWLFALGASAGAQVLTNGDFEKSSQAVGTNKVTTGFATIPGWKNIGGPATDSGVQYGTAGDAVNASQAGSYFAFQKSDDSTSSDANANKGAYQITSTVLQAGDRVTLTWYAVNTQGNPVQNVSLLAAPDAKADFNDAKVLAPANNPDLSLNATYTKYTIQYTATAADAGKNLGVSFSTTGDTNCYVQYDSFVITITPAGKS